MTFRVPGTATIAALLSCVGIAHASLAPVMIDDFKSAFESEEWFTGSIPQPGTVIPADQLTYNFVGLEIGVLWTTQGAVPGDIAPAYEARVSEMQSQMGLSVLGGSRASSLVAGDPNILGSRVSVNAYDRTLYGFDSGLLSFSTAFGTQGRLDLTYDAAGAGLDADFSNLGNARFALELVSGDLDQTNDQFDRPIPTTVTVVTGLGTPDEVTSSVTVDLLADDQFYFFEFADFMNFFSIPDFSDIDRITLTLDQTGPGLAAADFAVANFQVVPENVTPLVPAPGALSLAGLALVCTSRKRR